VIACQRYARVNARAAQQVLRFTVLVALYMGIVIVFSVFQESGKADLATLSVPKLVAEVFALVTIAIVVAPNLYLLLAAAFADAPTLAQLLDRPTRTRDLFALRLKALLAQLPGCLFLLGGALLVALDVLPWGDAAGGGGGACRLGRRPIAGALRLRRFADRRRQGAARALPQRHVP
jgi:hypothetical protein